MVVSFREFAVTQYQYARSFCRFQVGRALLDMVHSVPKMSSDQFDEMFNSNVKDLLMVVALSQLIKTQLQLNEKLTLLTTL